MAGWMEQWKSGCENGGGGVERELLNTISLYCKHMGRT